MNRPDKKEAGIGQMINDRLLRLPTTSTLIAFISVASVLTTLSVIFILNQPWNSLSVGAITSPSPVQRLSGETVSERPTRTPDQRRRDEAFLDSVETFGVEGMKEIYLNQSKFNNDGN